MSIKTKKEKTNREKLKEKKPKVLDKILAHETELIPRIQLQWRTAKGACNFNCEHCSVKDVGNGKDLITLEDVKRAFKEADELSISRVSISGGEPLTFDLGSLVEAINPSNFYIQLDTNGWLFTEEKAKYLKKIGIDCIAPSLDSLNFKEHDEFRRVKGSAERVIKAFDLIQKYDFNTYVQTVVTKSRLYSKEFKEFLEYFKNRKIGIFVSFAKPVGNFKGHFDEMVNKEDMDYFETLEKEYGCFSHTTPGYGLNEERHCIAGRNMIGIITTGDVIPCIYHYMSMGNIKTESLKSIYDRIKRLRIFKREGCPIANASDNFVEKYVVPLYDKDLPVSYKEILTEEDFD